jgi:hypothetical protein
MPDLRPAGFVSLRSEAVNKLGQAPSRPPIFQGFRGSHSEPVPFFQSLSRRAGFWRCTSESARLPSPYELATRVFLLSVIGSFRPVTRSPLLSRPCRTTVHTFQSASRSCFSRFRPKTTPCRAIVGHVARKCLRCGDLHFGFAWVRCPNCWHEMFVAFSCRQRCLGPAKQ